MRHLENMAKVMLATGLIVAYGYFFEFFMALYSGNKFDVFLVQQRLHGPYALLLLRADPLQHPDAATAVVPESAHQCRGAVRDVAGDQPGHVAGALRHRRHQS